MTTKEDKQNLNKSESQTVLPSNIKDYVLAEVEINALTLSQQRSLFREVQVLNEFKRAMNGHPDGFPEELLLGKNFFKEAVVRIIDTGALLEYAGENQGNLTKLYPEGTKWGRYYKEDKEMRPVMPENPSELSLFESSAGVLSGLMGICSPKENVSGIILDLMMFSEQQRQDYSQQYEQWKNAPGLLLSAAINSVLETDK